MTLSTEDRRRINQQNAARSTGPKTAEGKQKSRANALKHGLTAELLVLPNEDPQALQEQIDRWTDHYQPQDSEELFLVEQIAQAAIKLRRCTVHETGMLTDQIRQVDDLLLAQADERLEQDKKLLETNPQVAIRDLVRLHIGVDWMLERWHLLEKAILRTGGYLGVDGLTHEAVRLLGGDPRTPRDGSRQGFQFLLYDAAANTRPDQDLLDFLTAEETIHPDYHGLHGRFIPDQVTARKELMQMVENQIVDLEYLRQNRQQEALRALACRTQMSALPLDPKQGHLYLRYHKEAELSFHRNRKELERLQAKREAKSKEERKATKEPARNEANSAAGEAIRDLDTASCSEPVESTSEPSSELATPLVAMTPLVVETMAPPAPATVPVGQFVQRREPLV
jgi:hypothetical protein